MATRSIVTSQPDVTCDVCERRLLRGEQPELFLAAGQPRTVCELCAPRAAQEGWLRESAGESVALPPLRPRRGRNLFERLRQAGRPAAPAASDRAPGQEGEPYDFLDAPPAVAAAPVAAHPGHGGQAAAPAPAQVLAGGAVQDETGGLEHAIAAFNASEYPRRVASLTRSLGAPEVSVQAVDGVRGMVAIVLAWELCWYRYEVDLDDPGGEVKAVAQGTELSELGREDRLANALAGERGGLALAGA